MPGLDRWTWLSRLLFKWMLRESVRHKQGLKERFQDHCIYIYIFFFYKLVISTDSDFHDFFFLFLTPVETKACKCYQLTELTGFKKKALRRSRKNLKLPYSSYFVSMQNRTDYRPRIVFTKSDLKILNRHEDGQ